jgi:hypothetical protein
MSFFQQFPTTVYDINLDGVQDEVVDIFRYVDVKDADITDLATYTWYDIKDGERPDVVSQKLYGTPKYYWTFFVINDTLKHGLEDWPLSHSEIEKFLEYNFDKTSYLKLKTGVEPFLSETFVYSPSGDGTYQYEVNSSQIVSQFNFSGTLSGLSRISDNGEVIIKDVDTSEIAEIQNYDSTNNQISVKQGTIVSVTIDDAGANYVLAPSIVFETNPTGETAEAQCALNTNGSVGIVEITNLGSGYKTVPTITVNDGPDVPAQIEVNVLSDGTISPIVNVINPGSGYRKVPNLTISSPVSSGGTTATAVCALNHQGAISSVTITNVGSGYSNSQIGNKNQSPFVTVSVPTTNQAKFSCKILDQNWISNVNRFTLSIQSVNAETDLTSYAPVQIENIRYGLQVPGSVGYINLPTDPNIKYYPRFDNAAVKSITRGGVAENKDPIPEDYLTVARKCSIEYDLDVTIRSTDQSSGKDIPYFSNWTFNSQGPITYEISKDLENPSDNNFYTYVTYDTSGGLNPSIYTLRKKKEEWTLLTPGSGGRPSTYRVAIDSSINPAKFAGSVLNGNRWSPEAGHYPNQFFDPVMIFEKGPNISRILDFIGGAKNGDTNESVVGYMVEVDGISYFQFDTVQVLYNTASGQIDVKYSYEDQSPGGGTGTTIYSSFEGYKVTADGVSALIEFDGTKEIPTFGGWIKVDGIIKLTLSDLVVSKTDGAGSETNGIESEIGSYRGIASQQEGYSETPGPKNFDITLSPDIGPIDIETTVTEGGFDINSLVYYGSGNVINDGAGAGSLDPVYYGMNYFNRYIVGTENDGYYLHGMDPTSILNLFNYSYPLNEDGQLPYFTPTILGAKNTYYDVEFIVKTYQWDGSNVGPEIIDPIAHPVRKYRGQFDTGESGTATTQIFLADTSIPENVIKIASLGEVVTKTPYEFPTTSIWYDKFIEWVKTYYPKVYYDIIDKSKLPSGQISSQLFARNAERTLIWNIEEKDPIGRNALCHYESEDGKYESTGAIDAVNDIAEITSSQYELNPDSLPSPYASVPETPNFITITECLQRENDSKRKIRVIKPELINEFASSYRNLIQQ